MVSANRAMGESQITQDLRPEECPSILMTGISHWIWARGVARSKGIYPSGRSATKFCDFELEINLFGLIFTLVIKRLE